MEDFQPPSFSLGLDFDPEPDTVQKQAPVEQISQNLEEFEPETLDRNLQVENPIPVLKRLRRGPQTQIKHKEAIWPASPKLDDEIEEFSSQEDPCGVESSSVQNRLFSSTKFPLHSNKILATQSLCKPKVRKNTPSSSASISTSLEAKENKQMFPRLTIGPLGKFQLLDSDFDDPSATEDLLDNNKTSVLGKEKCNSNHVGMESKKRREKPSTRTSMIQSDDLWKDFSPKNSVNVHTPALDDFCEEYFRPVRGKNVGQKNVEKIPLYNSQLSLQRNSINDIDEQYWDNLVPPAHRYFYHDNPRIQRLVSERLPNFLPLGIVNNRTNMHSNIAAVDYRSQFGHHNSRRNIQGTSNRGKRKLESSYGKEVPHASRDRVVPINCTSIPKDAGKRRIRVDGSSADQAGISNRSKRKLESSYAQEASQASCDWANPKSSASIPKDAGKRRIQADGHSAGHWYTGQDGRKVYVNKNGQELNGQVAYKQYRKDKGAGRNMARKTTSKKK